MSAQALFEFKSTRNIGKIDSSLVSILGKESDLYTVLEVCHIGRVHPPQKSSLSYSAISVTIYAMITSLSFLKQQHIFSTYRLMAYSISVIP